MELHGLDNENQIFFYEQDYYIFSNFSSFAIEWNDKLYMTTEHAYHSEKFEDETIKEAIRNCKSGHDAFKLANTLKSNYRENWDIIKFDVMKEILRAKINQHSYVKKKLIDSGDREIIENSWRDDVWGWGPNRDGHNYLGKIWMELRKEFK